MMHRLIQSYLLVILIHTALSSDLGRHPDASVPTPQNDELLPDKCPQPLKQATGNPPSQNAPSQLLPPSPSEISPPTLGEVISELAATSNSTAIASNDILQSLGINCRGSFWCPWWNIPQHRYLAFILPYLQEKQGFLTSSYKAGSHIVCLQIWGDEDPRGYCLWAQGSAIPKNGVDGKTIVVKVQALIKHGCFACGSVPLGREDQPGGKGVLIMNYVSEVKCQRDLGEIVCKPDQEESGAGLFGPMFDLQARPSDVVTA